MACDANASGSGTTSVHSDDHLSAPPTSYCHGIAATLIFRQLQFHLKPTDCGANRMRHYQHLRVPWSE